MNKYKEINKWWMCPICGVYWVIFERDGITWVSEAEAQFVPIDFKVCLWCQHYTPHLITKGGTL